MTHCIVCATGNVNHQPAAFAKLKEFLDLQKSGRIVVVSAIPEIAETINDAISSVYSENYSGDGIDSILARFWINLTGIPVTVEFSELSHNLAKLLRGIRLTGDCSPALRDCVLSYSEHLSSLIFCTRLIDQGLNGIVKQPSELGLTVTSDFGNASCIKLQFKDLVAPAEDEVWIVPGSYGVTHSGKTARCGVSAADYIAAFIASVLNAPRLIIWTTDVILHCADTGIVPEAFGIPRLTYAEASELAYFDQFSMHPRTVEPLIRDHIPIHLIHPYSDDFEPFTVINSEDFISPAIVKSIASTDNISVLKLNGPGVGLKPGILAEITGKLSHIEVNIKSVITSQVSINILLDRKSGHLALKAAGELGFSSVSNVELLENVSLIAIVGHGMQQKYGISAILFGAVARNRINVLLSGSGASDLVSYLVVRSTDKQKSVRAIYDAFFQSARL